MLLEWEKSQPRVRPELNLVIKYKKLELPYVFFLSDRHTRLPDFPTISGLKAKNVVITSDDDPSSWHMPLLSVLGLDQHSFQSDSVLCNLQQVREERQETRSLGKRPLPELDATDIEGSRSFRPDSHPSADGALFRRSPRRWSRCPRRADAWGSPD